MIPLKLKNLSFQIINIYTGVHKIDAENHVKKILDLYGYKIEKDSETGHPDFTVYSNQENIFYVEVKTNGDGLKKEQVEWIINNPEKEVLVFYVNQINEQKKWAKLKKEKEKKTKQSKELKELSAEASGLV